MRIQDLLKKGREVLGSCERCKLSGLDDGVGSTFLSDAEILLAFVLGMSKEELIIHANDEISDNVSEKLFMEYIGEVACGKPVAYITKSKEFYGLDFYVDERVLIPRPETEMVVDVVLGYLKYRPTISDETGKIDLGKDFKMLDIGTGSLNIPVAVLHNFENILAQAVDKSAKALEVAVLNREYYGLEDRIEIYESDLLSSVGEKFFDVITANLPYVGTSANNFLEEGVRKNEPEIALFGGEDGFDLHRKLFEQIKEKGMDFNLLVGEFGMGQEELARYELSKYFPENGKQIDNQYDENGIVDKFCDKVDGQIGYKIEIKKDLAGIPRIYIVRKVGSG